MKPLSDVIGNITIYARSKDTIMQFSYFLLYYLQYNDILDGYTLYDDIADNGIEFSRSSTQFSASFDFHGTGYESYIESLTNTWGKLTISVRSKPYKRCDVEKLEKLFLTEEFMLRYSYGECYPDSKQLSKNLVYVCFIPGNVFSVQLIEKDLLCWNKKNLESLGFGHYWNE